MTVRAPDPHGSADVEVRLGAALERPALGRSGRRTAVAVGVALAFVAAVLAGTAMEWLLQHGVGGWLLARSLNKLRWLTVAASLPLLAAALLHAVWNGGPATSTALALSPTVGSAVARGTLVLTHDVAGHLLVASLAATVAVCSTALWNASESGRFARAVDENELLVASAVTAVAVAAIVELRSVTSPATATPTASAGALVVVPLSALAALWLAWLCGD